MSQVGRSDLASIQVTSADPERAAAIANAYAMAYLDHQREFVENLTAELEVRANALAVRSASPETDDALAEISALRVAAIAQLLADMDLVAAGLDLSTDLLLEAEAPTSPVARDDASKLVAAAIVGLLAGLTLLFGMEMLRAGRTAQQPDAMDPL